MHFSNNETNYTITQLSNVSRTALGTLLFFISMVGGAGNFIMCCLVIRHTKMHCIINILLSTMAMSDAFISIVCVPFDMATVVLYKWIFGNVLCYGHAFLLTTLIVQNIILLVIISIDRYYILVHKKHYLYDCRTSYLILACFLFAVLVSSPPLFGYGNFMFINDECKRIINPSGCRDVYLTFFSILLVVAPFGLLFLAYVVIIYKIKKTKHRIRPEFHRVVEPRRFVVGRQSFDARFKQKTFSTILCLYFAAMICKLPLAMNNLSEGNMYTESPWMAALTYSNSAINPFIYATKITSYWMVFYGKFGRVKERAQSLRYSRKRSNPESIYRVPLEITSSSLVVDAQLSITINGTQIIQT